MISVVKYDGGLFPGALWTSRQILLSDVLEPRSVRRPVRRWPECGMVVQGGLWYNGTQIRYNNTRLSVGSDERWVYIRGGIYSPTS